MFCMGSTDYNGYTLNHIRIPRGAHLELHLQLAGVLLTLAVLGYDQFFLRGQCLRDFGQQRLQLIHLPQRQGMSRHVNA